MVDGQDILQRLVRVLQVFFHADVVLDAQENDRRSDDQSTAEETPVAGEFGHVGQLVAVQAPHDCGTGRLDALVETHIVGRLPTRVAESAHEPVSVSIQSK